MLYIWIWQEKNVLLFKKREENIKKNCNLLHYLISTINTNKT